MVFNVRCFNCGEFKVRLILGGRAIIHARCHGCEKNLLAEIMEFEQQVMAELQAEPVEAEEDEEMNEDTASHSISSLTSKGSDEDTRASLQASSS